MAYNSPKTFGNGDTRIDESDKEQMENTTEKVMKDIFKACDVDNANLVSVSKLINFIAPFLQYNESELVRLKELLDPKDNDPKINVDAFYNKMLEWSASLQDFNENLNNANVGSGTEGHALSKMCNQFGVIDSSTEKKVDSDLVVYQEQIKELLYQRNKLSTELDFFKSYHEHCEEQINNLQANVNKISHDLKIEQQLNGNLQTALDEKKELLESFNAKQLQRNKLETALKNAEKETLDLQKQIEILISEKKCIENNYNNAIQREKDNQLVLLEIQSENGFKEQEIIVLREHNKELENSQNDQKSVIEHYNEVTQNLKKDKEDLEKYIQDHLTKAIRKPFDSAGNNNDLGIEKIVDVRLSRKNDPINVENKSTKLQQANIIDCTEGGYTSWKMDSNNVLPHDSLAQEIAQVQTRCLHFECKNVISKQQTELQELDIRIKESENTIKHLASNVDQLHLQITNKDKRLKEYKEKTNNLQNKVKELEKENNSKYIKIVELMEQNVNSQKHAIATESNEQLNMLKESITNLENKKQLADELIKKMQSEQESSQALLEKIQFLDNQCDDLKSNLAKAALERESLSKQYEQKISDLTKEREELRNNYNYLKIALEQKTSDEEEVLKSYNKLSFELSEMELENDKLKADVSASKSAQEVGFLRTEAEEYLIKTQQQYHDLAERDRKIGVLKTMIEHQNNEIKALENEKNQKAYSLHKQQCSNDKLSDECSSLLEQLKQKQEECLALDNQLISLRTLNSTIQYNFEEVNGKYNELLISFRSLHDYQVLESDKQLLQSDKKELEKENEILSQSNEKLNTTIAQLKTEINNSLKKSQSDVELSKIKKDYEAIQNAYEALANEKKELVSEKSAIVTAKNQLQKDLRKTKLEINHLTEQLAKLKISNQNSVEQEKKLTAKLNLQNSKLLEQMNENSKRHQEEKLKLTTELVGLKDQLQTALEDLQFLQAEKHDLEQEKNSIFRTSTNSEKKFKETIRLMESRLELSNKENLKAKQELANLQSRRCSPEKDIEVLKQTPKEDSQGRNVVPNHNEEIVRLKAQKSKLEAELEDLKTEREAATSTNEEPSPSICEENVSIKTEMHQLHDLAASLQKKLEKAQHDLQRSEAKNLSIRKMLTDVQSNFCIRSAGDNDEIQNCKADNEVSDLKSQLIRLEEDFGSLRGIICEMLQGKRLKLNRSISHLLANWRQFLDHKPEMNWIAKRLNRSDEGGSFEHNGNLLIEEVQRFMDELEEAASLLGILSTVNISQSSSTLNNKFIKRLTFRSTITTMKTIGNKSTTTSTQDLEDASSNDGEPQIFFPFDVVVKNIDNSQTKLRSDTIKKKEKNFQCIWFCLMFVVICIVLLIFCCSWMMLALMRARFGLEENGVDVPTFLLRF